MHIWYWKSFPNFFFTVIFSIFLFNRGKVCLVINNKNKIDEKNLNPSASYAIKISTSNLNNPNNISDEYSYKQKVFNKTNNHYNNKEITQLKTVNENSRKNTTVLNTTSNKVNSNIKDKILNIFERTDDKLQNLENGFYNEFTTSFSLNFFSEIGDKSFIAVFLFTNQASWITLFLVASITEIIFNLLSVVIGHNLRAYESIHILIIYITIFTTLLFGILLLKEAIYDSENEEKNLMKKNDLNENTLNHNNEIVDNEKDLDNEKIDNLVDTSLNDNNKIVDNEKDLDKEKIDKSEEDSKNFFLLIFKIFWVVLLSELGDKSQIVTIILSTHHNPIPVFLGTALAHVLGVLLSILLGNIVSSKLSNRILNLIAASCFIGYGLFISYTYFFNVKS